MRNKIYKQKQQKTREYLNQDTICTSVHQSIINKSLLDSHFKSQNQSKNQSKQSKINTPNQTNNNHEQLVRTSYRSRIVKRQVYNRQKQKNEYLNIQIKSKSLPTQDKLTQFKKTKMFFKKQIKSHHPNSKHKNKRFDMLALAAYDVQQSMKLLHQFNSANLVNYYNQQLRKYLNKNVKSQQDQSDSHSPFYEKILQQKILQMRQRHKKQQKITSLKNTLKFKLARKNIHRTLQSKQLKRTFIKPQSQIQNKQQQISFDELLQSIKQQYNIKGNSYNNSYYYNLKINELKSQEKIQIKNNRSLNSSFKKIQQNNVKQSKSFDRQPHDQQLLQTNITNHNKQQCKKYQKYLYKTLQFKQHKYTPKKQQKINNNQYRILTPWKGQYQHTFY